LLKVDWSAIITQLINWRFGNKLVKVKMVSGDSKDVFLALDLKEKSTTIEQEMVIRL